MKTLTIYSFSELSEKAKENAIENYRKKNCDQPILWADETLDSLKELFKACDGIKLKDYSLGDQNSSIDVEFSRQEAGELSGKRAMAWIENNLLYRLRIPYKNELTQNGKNNRNELRKYGSSYYAGQIKPCPFTGYCADEDFLNSLLKDIKEGTDLKTAFEGLASEYQRIYNAEVDYQNSDEYISETLEANDYDFTIEGKQI